jgi:hypothetical protein
MFFAKICLKYRRYEVPMCRCLISMIVLLTSITVQAEQTYCLALRGNGELVPSHWGALSHTFETFGLPQTMAGGSSASISTFLVDSIFQNPILKKEKDPQTRALYTAFLIKSVQGYISSQLNTPEWKTFGNFIKGLTAEDGSLQQLDRLLADMSAENTQELITVINEIRQAKIFYGPAIEKFDAKFRNINPLNFKEWYELSNLAAQIRLSISLIGKFDAKNDNNLLIRDGVVNFPAAVELYGRIGLFYSLTGATSTTVDRFKAYLSICGKNSVGKTWTEFIEDKPNCETDLAALIASYKEDSPTTTEAILDQPMGQGLRSIVTAGVVRNQSYRILQDAKKEFETTFSPTAGNVVLNPTDIFFAYAGNKEALLNAEKMKDSKHRFASIDKSKRFMSLGHTTWREALGFSGNEPGLGAFTTFSQDGEEMAAIGGWSDLHPTLVLKASGCEKVIYVTRRGGDTIFGQGLAKRIFGFDNIAWESLDPYSKDPNIKIYNNNGREVSTNSLWDDMYNLANPNSSFAFSLSEADAVVCTNWNGFDVTKELEPLITDSYRAPIYNPGELTISGLKKVSVISQAENVISPETGYYLYSGCIPLN